MSKVSNLFKTMNGHPKNVFLLDGIGALVSTIFLGVVLVQLQTYIGMPKSILYTLAAMAFGYAIYSFSCYFFLNKNWSPFLKIIAFANLFHCVVTVFLMYNNYHTLTSLGIFYFAVEIIIVIGVAMLELKTANQITK